MPMNLHMEALGDEEVAEAVDQGLASLRTRIQDPEGDWKQWPELAAAIERACDAWDEVANALPGFRPIDPEEVGSEDLPGPPNFERRGER